ncbi:unnamed protein product [Rotaria sordida]|uniref:Uncharacterized protein n=1 Tax=Rotaria sordida TaxID=392033 RepID=A0A814W5L0_9BILA|nr:unnamed protein product [Rotaria sordida]CAF1197554.1 unnamed protein product [Rotaria sordida]
MSRSENIDQDSTPPPSSSSLTNRHFLIVPSFNPERRHSWANIVSHISARNSNINPYINVANVEITR